MAVLNLLSRRARQRDDDFFEDCSDDDLMTWGRELAGDGEPIFVERLPRRPGPTAGPVPVPALALSGASEPLRRRSA